MEEWINRFLNKQVICIVEDSPSPYPKKKEGIFKGVSKTHIIILRDNKLEAIRLIDVRRVELIEVEK